MIKLDEYTFSAQWRDANTDPPKQNGEYLTCHKSSIYKDGKWVDTGIVEIANYAKDLYKVNDFDFEDKKGKSGWYDWDSEWDHYEINDIIYWMPLPKTPIDLD